VKAGKPWLEVRGTGLEEGDQDLGAAVLGQKKARLRKARRLLIVPFKTKILLNKLFYADDSSF
jgi:hypothetical protein